MSKNSEGSFKTYKTCSEVFSYSAIANDVIISEKPDQITAILEMHISSNDDVSTMQHHHDRLMKLFCEFPDDITISILKITPASKK